MQCHVMSSQVRDHDRLFTMILSSLAIQPEVWFVGFLFLSELTMICLLWLQLTEGAGQLLFEVCKGVPKQFHSCTEMVHYARVD